MKITKNVMLIFGLFFSSLSFSTEKIGFELIKEYKDFTVFSYAGKIIENNFIFYNYKNRMDTSNLPYGLTSLNIISGDIQNIQTGQSEYHEEFIKYNDDYVLTAIDSQLTHKVLLINKKTNEVIPSIGLIYKVTDAYFINNEVALFQGSEFDTTSSRGSSDLLYFSLPNFKLTHKKSISGDVIKMWGDNYVTFSKNYLYVYDSDFNLIKIINIPVKPEHIKGNTNTGPLSIWNNQAIITANSGYIYIFDLVSGNIIKTLDSTNMFIYHTVIDDKLIALQVDSPDKPIIIYDLNTYESSIFFGLPSADFIFSKDNFLILLDKRKKNSNKSIISIYQMIKKQ